jgi:hypothetical protein
LILEIFLCFHFSNFFEFFEFFELKLSKFLASIHVYLVGQLKLRICNLFVFICIFVSLCSFLCCSSEMFKFPSKLQPFKNFKYKHLSNKKTTRGCCFITNLTCNKLIMKFIWSLSFIGSYILHTNIMCSKHVWHTNKCVNGWSLNL